MFCPKCKSLLYPEEGKMVCRKEDCDFTSDMGKPESSVKKTKKVKADILVLDEITKTMPTTKVECEECGNNEATYTMRQTRAADEPTTRIYRCTKCGNTWREF